MADTPKHSVSVAGIVVNDKDEVLVIKRRDNGNWEMPGGVLELNETFEEGVVREVQEETGMPVNVNRLTGIYKNMNKGIVSLVFSCTPLTDGLPIATGEAQEVAWFTRDQVEEEMKRAFAVRVQDSFEDPVVTRYHNGEDKVTEANKY